MLEVEQTMLRKDLRKICTLRFRKVYDLKGVGR